MTTVIQDIPAAKAQPEVVFDFSPHGTAFSYNVGAMVYSPSNTYHADIETSLTFTAVASFDNITEYAIKYEWSFGDGTKGFGNPVTHTYDRVLDDVQVVLTMIDSKGRRTRVRKQMYLTP